MIAYDAQTVEHFRKAFEALPDRTREVFWLHLAEQLDYPAIAARLGIDASIVEAELAEAIVRIDAALRDAAPGSG